MNFHVNFKTNIFKTMNRCDPTRPNTAQPQRFLTTYISKTKWNKKCKLWGNALYSKLRIIKFSKGFTERNDHENMMTYDDILWQYDDIFQITR